MKKAICIIASFLCLQILSAQTSMEEYNYITKGLIDHVTKGADIKTGYRLGTTITERKLTRDGMWRSVSVRHFTNRQNKPVAYVLECRDGSGSQRYLCVPSQASSQDVWDRCYSDLLATGDEWRTVFMWAFIIIAGMQI